MAGFVALVEVTIARVARGRWRFFRGDKIETFPAKAGIQIWRLRSRGACEWAVICAVGNGGIDPPFRSGLPLSRERVSCKFAGGGVIIFRGRRRFFAEIRRNLSPRKRECARMRDAMKSFDRSAIVARGLARRIGVSSAYSIRPSLRIKRTSFPALLRCDFRSECFFADSQSAFIERFGGGVIALHSVKLRQIVEGCSRVGVLRSESFFANSQSAFMERFGGGVIALRIVKKRQIVERYGRAGVLRSECFFFDSQSAFKRGSAAA